MLTFFRRIRLRLLGRARPTEPSGRASSDSVGKSLLPSGTTRKYIFYAVGEVALVVIGILIALQINNWNEWKKARNFEIKMLSEIRESLRKDTSYFHMLTGRATRIDTSTERIIHLIVDDTYNDILILDQIKNITHTYTFIYQDGAYEALKASGIEKVSNDSLRNNLIDHYGFRMPRYVKLMNFYRNDSDMKLVEDLEWDLFEFKADVFNDRPEISILGLKPNVIGSEPFNRYIRVKRREASWGLQWLEIMTDETKWLLRLLNAELD